MVRLTRDRLRADTIGVCVCVGRCGRSLLFLTRIVQQGASGRSNCSCLYWQCARVREGGTKVVVCVRARGAVAYLCVGRRQRVSWRSRAQNASCRQNKLAHDIAIRGAAVVCGKAEVYVVVGVWGNRGWGR